MGDLHGPHLIYDSLGQYNPNGITIGTAVFLQMTEECPILYNRPSSPLKIAPPNGGCVPPSNTWFLGPIFVSDIAIFVLKRDVKLQLTNLGPTRVLNPNAIVIGSTIFAGLTTVTDRQTDRQTMLLGR